MKKIFTLAVCALAAMTATAQFNFMSDAMRQEFPTKAEAIKAPQGMTNRTHKLTVKAADEAAGFEGNFVHSVWVYDEDYDYIESSCGVTFTKEDDGTYTISNFLGRGGNIKATLDAESGQLVAEPGQLLYTHSSYGDIVIYSVFIDDDYNLQVDTESKLYFSIDGDRIMIDNDGIVMVLKEGQYAGYILGTYMLYVQFDRANGTMTYTNGNNEEKSYDIAWDGDAVNNGYVYIYGFANLSCVTIMTDAETGLAYMENGQDVLYYNQQYGMFSTVALATENGKYYLADSTAGSFDVENNIINLELFGFGNSAGNLFDLLSNTVITGPSLDPVVGIDDVAIENKQDAAPIFDLMGRQAVATRKGQLFIREGRKFIVR